MNPLFLAGLGFCALLMVIGGIMVLVAAFRAHVLWGLAYLFVPLASLVFIGMHWPAAKRGTLLSLAGLLLFGGVLYAAPETRTALAQVWKPAFSFAPAAEKKPARDLSAEIAERREKIEPLQAQVVQAAAALGGQFKQLEARRLALKADDAAAIAQFNDAAAAYRAQNAQAAQWQKDLATLHNELTALLDERSHQTAATAAAAGPQRVTMFTTKSCGACRMAKQYFAQKGVTYDERDVENSPEAMQEFRRLGGSGVPLIMIGEKRLEGFNAQALDQLLAAK